MNAPRFRLILLAAAALVLLLGACTLNASGTPELDRSSNFTQAAQTLDAQLTLAADGAFPTVTPLLTQAGTSIPVITQTTTGNQAPEETAAPGSQCDRGEFVEDVSIPDGTAFKPGETFVKTWRIRNNGTCTWTSDYTVVFESGDAMSGPASFPLTTSNVPPGSEVEISINLTAPEEPGSYRGDWLLRNPAGQNFGLGSQGTASFWVIISVQDEPEASVSFDNFHDCGGNPTAIFRLTNNGDTAFDSVEITFNNLGNGLTVFGPFASNGPFMGAAGECPPGGDSAAPGATTYIGGAIGDDSVSGQTIEAVFTLCTQEDLSGACLESTVEFEVP